MPSKQITFSDIQTSDLIYYDQDPKLVNRYSKFCHERAIDCLPSLDDPYKFYQCEGEGFSEKDVTPERRAMGSQNIFDPSLLERFQYYKLLFVYNGDELTGVVHFSDYNRSAVTVYLYDLLISYERSLRRLLELRNLNDDHMLAYLSKKEVKTEGDGQEKIPAFERFNLSNLIGLAEQENIMTFSKDVHKLRNMIMHARDLVHLSLDSQDDYIYNVESFTRFFERVNGLFFDYRRVRSRVALLEQEQEDKVRKLLKAQ